MANVPTSTLEDIRTALLAAKSAENAAYMDYSGIRDREGVPSSIRDIADNTDDAHRQFQETMDQFLMYWADRNTVHLTDGSAALKRCIGQANDTVTRINVQR